MADTPSSPDKGSSSGKPQPVREPQGEASGLGKFWAELRRRKVVRVAVAYLIVGWLIIQIAVSTFPKLSIPGWAESLVIMCVILGFPVALIIAWAFEVTPEGIKADAGVRAGESVAPAKGQKHNYITMGLVVLVLTFLVVDRYVFSPKEIEATNGSSSNTVSPDDVKRMVIDLDEGQELALAALAPLGVGRLSLAVSPNGRHLVYVVDNDGESQIYLRYLSEFVAHPVEGTEGAFGLFFSPDSQWIGFLKKGRIMKLSVNGGTPQTITEAGNVYGASWGLDDNIFFVERDGIQLVKVSADGGDKEVLTKGRFANPECLPDGKSILLTDTGGQINKVVLFNLETGDTVTLIERGGSPRFVPTGHIVYTSESGISAVPFDLSTYSITGPAAPILDEVRREQRGLSQLTFSTKGWLAYIPGADTQISKLVWVDRKGGEEPLPIPRQRYGPFRLSPDNSQVAILIFDPSPEVWLYDIDRSTPLRRLTVGGLKAPGVIWNPDGKSAVFGMNRYSALAGNGGIFQQRVNGEQLLPIVADDSSWHWPGSWVIDDLLVYVRTKVNSEDSDIWVARLEKAVEPEPFVATSASEMFPSMSPDGRFIAYTSDESGMSQVYVKPYPPTEMRWPISTGYGEEPIWSATGDEIFFRRGEEWLSVAVQTDPEFEVGVPKVIFKGPYTNVPGISYDVAADSQRFLVLKPPEQPAATKIHVVANWSEELKRLVPIPE